MSDIALTHGRWVRDPRTGIQRWQPDPRPLEAHDVTCPFCDAAPGNDCTSTSGSPIQGVHSRRAELARRDALGGAA